MPNPDIKDPLVPQQDNSVFDSIPERSWREELKYKQPASTAEPVATLPACLCGLDTNPVASPRMDIHCPKHDVPEDDGEPELPQYKAVQRYRPVDGVDFPAHVDIYEKTSDYPCVASVHQTRRDLAHEIVRLLNTRVSQPADWLKDNEIKRLTDERNQLAQQGAELTLAERERCAKIAEHAQIGDGYTGHYVNGFLIAQNQIAVAIRNQRDDTE